MNQVDNTFWPASLAHLTLPYVDVSSQYVTIAEISSELVNGYPGTRIYTNRSKSETDGSSRQTLCLLLTCL